ncbi:rhodanese-like domain-containing protein [Gluconacetobacter sacchari]|uniref:rhodanese-like domain-containing protein n=1 Tax=Gluconacetobacter sacchari TaxID=92759 RepID=UPI0039B3CD1B
MPGPDGTTGFAPGLAAFEGGHIRDARFADPGAPFPFTMPTAGQLERAARAVGIDNDSTLVIYDQLNGAYAARLWFVFMAYGFRNARVLNGGRLPGSQQAGPSTGDQRSPGPPRAISPLPPGPTC